MRKGVPVALAVVALAVVGALLLRSAPEPAAGGDAGELAAETSTSSDPAGTVDVRRANARGSGRADPAGLANPFAAKDAELDPLRRRMRRYPDDIEVRREFLQATRRDISHAQWRERADVVLWFVENHPGDLALRGMHLLRDADEQLWHDADEAWRQALAAADVSTDVLINAADWYSVGDPAASAELFHELQQREPDHADWYLREAHGHHMAGMTAHGDPEARREHSADAVQAFQVALGFAEGEERKRALASGVGAAIETGEWDTARSWLMELETTADPGDDSTLRHARWSLARGLIDTGDLEGAEAELLQMGGDPPPGAIRYSPGLSIARRLALEGRTEAVLEYLDLLGSWDPAQVDAWRQQLLAGEVPDFRYRPPQP